MTWFLLTLSSLNLLLIVILLIRLGKIKGQLYVVISMLGQLDGYVKPATTMPIDEFWSKDETSIPYEKPFKTDYKV